MTAPSPVPVPVPHRRREFLGNAMSAMFSERQYAYLTDDAVEVDQVDGYDIVRRRVFLTDVEAVTLHRRQRTAARVVGAVFLVLALGATYLIAEANSSVTAALWFSLVVDLPLLLFVLHAAVVPRRVVQVFGTRTKAGVEFSFRVGRAETVYERLCRAVAAAQAVPVTQSAAAPVATAAAGAGEL